LTVSARGTIGWTNIYKKPFFPVVRLLVLTPKSELENLDYLYACMKNIENDYQFAKVGIAQLTKPMIKETKITISLNLKEQQKIGKFFNNLDNLILAQEKKYKKLENIKKALLEKLFPKDNTKIPEIRFKGFSEEWEERELWEIVNRYDNLRIPIKESDRIKGKTPYYGANGIQDYVNGFTHEGEFILVAEDGANDLENYPVHYVNGKIWVNNHAHVLQAKKQISDNYFLKCKISNFNIEPFLVGGSRAKLNADTMMKINFKIPKYKEQQKIGKFFKNLDKLLDLQKQKLDKLKQIKQAMLDKMLV